MSPQEPVYVVAGGTANVGSFVVARLLSDGATVIVPSRSAERVAQLRDHLKRGAVAAERLETIVADLGDPDGAEVLRRRVTHADGVVASLGQLVLTEDLLTSEVADLRRVLDAYVVAHLDAARLFLPALRETGGSYVMLQGPLAFGPAAPELGTDLVTIATAAQHMLFEVLARDCEGTDVRLVELVSHAFIADRETQPGSPLTGEDVGRYIGGLLSGTVAARNSESIQLRSPEQVEDTAR